MRVGRGPHARLLGPYVSAVHLRIAKEELLVGREAAPHRRRGIAAGSLERPQRQQHSAEVGDRLARHQLALEVELAVDRVG